MKTRSPLRHAGGALAALVVAVGLGACTPGTDITLDESDIAATQFDDTVDFGAITTIAIADSIVHLTSDGSDDPNFSRANDAAILDRYQMNLEAAGYTVSRVDSVSQGLQSDAVFVVAVASSDFYQVSGGCGGYYYWWWYYGCYYPPSASYAYSTGSLLSLMLDPDELGGDGLTPMWVGAINGVLSSRTDLGRVNRNIDQLFAQSPYLGRSQ